MQLNEKNIFLLDGIGAALSACFTGLILIRYSLFLGINISTLQNLALLPSAYAIYSLSCYFFISKTKPWMLLTIIGANLFYCLISLFLILFRERITWRGQLLLSTEIVVVLLVVLLEFNIYRKIKPQQ
ncbi:MAG: hypothetical protein NDI63_11250 [Pseudobdellovibrio sp.]|nr:hypothetical protein [Pseudobdellovibrio sp.]